MGNLGAKVKVETRMMGLILEFHPEFVAIFVMIE